ncbi:hypothetical protein L9F63_013658, partial [Diploptera punctata]
PSRRISYRIIIQDRFYYSINVMFSLSCRNCAMQSLYRTSLNYIYLETGDTGVARKMCSNFVVIFPKITIFALLDLSSLLGNCRCANSSLARELLYMKSHNIRQKMESYRGPLVFRTSVQDRYTIRDMVGVSTITNGRLRLEFHDHLTEKSHEILINASKGIRDVVYVSVHVRRTDYAYYMSEKDLSLMASCNHTILDYGKNYNIQSGHRLDSGNLFWRIQLDQDLLDTIIAIYPEWFKDYNLSRVGTTMAEGGSGGTGAAPDTGHTSGGQPSTPNSTGLLPLSPPKAEVDDSPLQKSMDKNKE